MDKIFLPSTGVDMVFNMNSLAPYSRSSIIYDTSLKNNEIIIAQPLTPFSENTQFRELHLTTIIRDENRKLRVGVECVQFRLIDKYQLANGTNVSAVVLKYNLPIKETNIRSAFRLPLSTKYAIKGKIFHNNMEYMTSRDFSIRDISLAGLGLKIAKKRDNRTNPLTQIKIREKISIGIVLINMDQDKPIGTLPLTAQVVRIKPDHTETQSLMGVKILNLKTNDETILNKFIHEAQVDELKKLSRRSL
ncbi:MAG: PilZ domain-containing protein [Desulfobacula sp.]|nr:PilZ domain-containing protein [Desulfobacula sp.]